MVIQKTQWKYDEGGRLVPSTETAEPEPVVAPVAAMEQGGVFGGIARADVMGLPLGVAGIAAVGDFVLDKLLGERLATWGALGQLGAAFVVKSYGKRFLGAPTADAMAFVLTYEALRETVQTWLESVWPAPAAPVEQRRRSPSPQHAGAQQAGAISSDYYAWAFRS